MGADGLAAQGNGAVRQVPQRSHGEVGAAEEELGHGRRGAHINNMQMCANAVTNSDFFYHFL